MVKVIRRVGLVLLAALLCLVLVACGTDTQTTPPAPPETGAPATGTTTDGGAAATGGEALAKQKCTMCHTYDRVEQASKSAAEWEATIQRMVDQGLAVTAEERTAITQYLVDRDN